MLRAQSRWARAPFRVPLLPESAGTLSCTHLGGHWVEGKGLGQCCPGKILKEVENMALKQSRMNMPKILLRSAIKQ